MKDDLQITILLRYEILTISSPNIKCSRWTETRNKKTLLSKLKLTLLNGSSNVSSEVIKEFLSWFSFKES